MCVRFLFSYRHLDAFILCPFGESRVYTSPKVTDQCSYFNKSQTFNTSLYDPDHMRMSEFTPGFNFVDIVGGPLRVVGIVNKSGSLEQLEEFTEKRSRDKISRYFFIHVLIPALNRLPSTTRTRRHNLSLCSVHCSDLPDYFRIYEEDVDALSVAICSAQRTLPPDVPYRFYFAFFKFGQQVRITDPINIRTIGFSHIIRKPERLCSSSIHIATTLTHTSPNFSTFWNLLSPTPLYTGRDVKKYPFFGLSQIGNITVNTPTDPTPILNAWHPNSRQSIRLTYVQFYSPLTKSFSSKPFQDHPFLVTLMLGQEYVASNPTFHKIHLATEKDADYLALKEAIILHLHQASSRFEVVVAGSDLVELLRVNLQQLAETIKRAHLLVQVSKERKINVHCPYWGLGLDALRP